MRIVLATDAWEPQVNGVVRTLTRTVAECRGMGHEVEVINDSYQDFGAGQFIWRMGDPAEDGYVAASDPRRDGQAVVF